LWQCFLRKSCSAASVFLVEEGVTNKHAISEQLTRQLKPQLQAIREIAERKKGNYQYISLVLLRPPWCHEASSAMILANNFCAIMALLRKALSLRSFQVDHQTS
jgi:hypothetical protein